MVVLNDPPLGCRGERFAGDLDFDKPMFAGVSGGSTSDMLRVWESPLPLCGVAAGGRPKSKESSAWPPSFSSFCGSTTGSVMVSRKTGRLATRPKILSNMFLSDQLVNVGNRVEIRTCGVGMIPEGHHFGILAASI